MGNQLGTSDEVLLNMSLVAGDALDPWDLTRMDVELREQVMPIIDWLRRNFDEFKDCRLAAIAPKIGVRGGRTAVTEEMITCQSLIDGVPVAEPIALAHRTFGGHGINKFRNDWDKYHLSLFQGQRRLNSYRCKKIEFLLSFFDRKTNLSIFAKRNHP